MASKPKKTAADDAAAAAALAAANNGAATDDNQTEKKVEEARVKAQTESPLPPPSAENPIEDPNPMDAPPSHPAMTTAEETYYRSQGAQVARTTSSGDIGSIESRQDESGEVQRATREAIGAGTGAPDGIVDSPQEV